MQAFTVEVKVHLWLPGYTSACVVHSYGERSSKGLSLTGGAHLLAKERGITEIFGSGK